MPVLNASDLGSLQPDQIRCLRAGGRESDWLGSSAAKSRTGVGRAAEGRSAASAHDFVQGVRGINSFDRWCIEPGKALVELVAGELASAEPDPDRHGESTSALIAAVHDHPVSAFVFDLDLMEGRST